MASILSVLAMIVPSSSQFYLLSLFRLSETVVMLDGFDGCLKALYELSLWVG
jgi:hypothetical protein